MLRQSAASVAASDVRRRCDFGRIVVADLEKTTCFSATRKSRLASLRIIGNVLVGELALRAHRQRSNILHLAPETVLRRWKFNLLQRLHEASDGPQSSHR